MMEEEIMFKVNDNYQKLPGSYLFSTVAKKTRAYQNEHPDEEVDKEAFQYPGPNPFTKEQAILMMADAVEAASRSLKSYTEESISTLVDKIIDGQVQDGFFKECPITFKDIATVKSVFKEKLKTMYHTRISYPELKK